MPKSPRHANAFSAPSLLFSVGISLGFLSIPLFSGLAALGQTETDSLALDGPQGENDTAAADQNSDDIATNTKLVFDNAQTSLLQNAFIAAPMSGVVSTVTVSEGENVTTDSPLVKMRSELAEKELVVAGAALDAARIESDNDVNLRYAQRTLEVRESEMRQSQLANQAYAGSVSAMELQQVRLKVDQAALAIEQANHELTIAAAKSVEKEASVSIAKTKLDRHTVRASVAGMVAQIDVEPGEWAEAGKPLVRIISLDPIRVECFIDGRKHGRPLVGRAVTFIPTGAADDARLNGSITFVSPELHPVTGQVRLWATIKNPGGKIGSGTPGRLIVR